jgi:hypothetical protein
MGIALLVAAAACGGSSSGGSAAATTVAGDGTGAPTPAELKEASRLVNLGDSSKPPPSDVVDCVARTVVRNPLLDQAANNIAQIPDKDLREAVMYSYLQCGHTYILDTYMRFAPAGLTKKQLACIRSKFDELRGHTFAEVIVLDPDAEFTGPLVIQACKTGSKTNPLLNNGALIGMGGS